MSEVYMPAVETRKLMLESDGSKKDHAVLKTVLEIVEERARAGQDRAEVTITKKPRWVRERLLRLGYCVFHSYGDRYVVLWR